MNNLLNLMIFIVGSSMSNPIEIEDGKFKGNNLVSKFEIQLEESNIEVIDYDKLIMEMTEKANDEYYELSNTTIEDEYLIFEATHFDPWCDTGCIGITKTGYDVRNTIHYNGMRIIAVDPKIIPLYTIVEVDAPYGTFKAIALDTGGSIKNTRIDILVKTRKEAYKLGRHDVKIKILELPNTN